MSQSFDPTFLPFPFMSSLWLDFPMNLKHAQCCGKRIICFNFIDWAKNRWGPFLFLECYTSRKVNLTVSTGSRAWGRKQILNIAECDQKAGLEMALHFDKLTLLYYSICFTGKCQFSRGLCAHRTEALQRWGELYSWGTSWRFRFGCSHPSTES